MTFPPDDWRRLKEMSSGARETLEGRRIGPYQLASRIGMGGMGEVYQARDTTLNRQVAIKVLLPAVANDPDRLGRFRREAQVLASLNHPHIAQVHGFEEADGVRALVMELVDGPTLADRIASGAIAMAEALSIATQIAEAARRLAGTSGLCQSSRRALGRPFPSSRRASPKTRASSHPRAMDCVPDQRVWAERDLWTVFPGPGGKARVSTQGGSQPRWRRDGKELFFVAPDNRLMAVPVARPPNGQALNVGAPVPLFAARLALMGSPKHQYAVAPDGQQFLMVVSADETIASPITIVQNWLAGLQVPEVHVRPQ